MQPTTTEKPGMCRDLRPRGTGTSESFAWESVIFEMLRQSQANFVLDWNAIPDTKIGGGSDSR